MKKNNIIPGELHFSVGNIELNAGRKIISISVENLGNRPIQIGSHFHFYEVNIALQFNRIIALGFRLNIPSGTTIRFAPGQAKVVELVKYSGNRKIYGFNKAIMGKFD